MSKNAEGESTIRPIVVSPATAAEMLDVTRAHVYQLIGRGTLRRCQIEGSRSVRVPIEDVYAAAGLTAPDAELIAP